MATSAELEVGQQRVWSTKTIRNAAPAQPVERRPVPE